MFAAHSYPRSYLRTRGRLSGEQTVPHSQRKEANRGSKWIFLDVVNPAHALLPICYGASQGHRQALAAKEERGQKASLSFPSPTHNQGDWECPLVRHRLCRPTANETLVSRRVVGIELRRRVCFFVVLKRGNARGAKGVGHRL
jgi:hypothetical protein